MYRYPALAAVAFFSLAFLFANPTPAAAVTGSIYAVPSALSGTNTTTYVTWSSTGASFCYVYAYSVADPVWRSWDGGLAKSNVPAGGITSNTTFKLRCDSGAFETSTTVTYSPVSLSIAASPTTVSPGGTAYVTWSATGVSSCGVYTSTTADPTLRSWESGLSGASRPYGGIMNDTTFTLRCDGGAHTRTFTVRTTASAPSVDISASPQAIQAGQSTYISFTSQNISSCAAFYTLPGQPRTYWTDRTSLLNARFPLTGNATFDITCQSPSGAVSDAVTVTVTQPTPSVTLTLSTSTIQSGGYTNVSFTAQNVSSCREYYTYEGGTKTFWTDRMVMDNIRFGPLTQNTTFEVSCIGTNGQTVTKTAAVTVVSTLPPPPADYTLPPPTPRTPSFYIIPARSVVPIGSSTVIKWQAPSDATNCHVYSKTATSNQWFGTGWYDGSSHTAAGRPDGAPTGPISEGMIYSLRCTFPTGVSAVSGIVLPDYNISLPNTAACGITDARLRQIRYLLDKFIVTEVNDWGLNANRQNYPQALYDMQEITATTLAAAGNCKDRYLLDRLAIVYSVPFVHIEQDRNGDWVWLENKDTSGQVKENFEQVLASTQFMSGAAKLLAKIVQQPDPNSWTHAMYSYLSYPRGVVIAHFDRWMNKKSMWTWPECGYSQPSYLWEYTFPEYAQRKLDRTMTATSTAPSYCNMLNDVELLTGTGAMELVVADSMAHNRVGLSTALYQQLVYFTRTMAKLFESRISNIRSTSPLCGGACDVAGVDIGGRRGHGEYPASLWPDGNETMDISHARRMVDFVDVMYYRADISLPQYSLTYISNYLSRAITYLAFNGSFTDPAFTNFLNGKNVQYRDYGPYKLSADYLRTGYSLWWPYNRDIKRINDAITTILDTKTPTTYLTPGGNPPAGDIDRLAFYSSLTKPSYAPVAFDEQNSMLANVLSAVGDWFSKLWNWLFGIK